MRGVPCAYGLGEGTALAIQRSSFAIARLGVLVALVIAGGIAFLIVGTDGVREILESAGNSAWGAFAFFLAYVALVVLMLPGTIGTLAAGAVLGFKVGFPVALSGALVGATIAFFLGRALGREGVEQILGERARSVDEWIGSNDLQSIIVLRLMPIVPFNMLNYAAGLAKVRPSRYILGSLIGMIPGTAASTATASMASDGTPTQFAIAGSILLVFIVVSSVAGRRYVAKQRAQAAAGE